MTTPAAAKKARTYGRVYPIPRPGSDQVVDLPSVSNLLKVLAAPGLEIWKQKTLAASFAFRPDLVLLAANEDTRWDAIQQALDNRSAANKGTSYHSFTEMVDDGNLMWELVPEAAKPMVTLYAQAKEDYGWEMVAKEFTVFNHTLGYAGTSDRALKVPGYEDVPIVAIADVKTGKEIWPDQALQLAFYAHGEGIWKPATGNPETLPETVARQEILDAMIASGLNENGKKLSKAATDRKQAEINELMWAEYALAGQHFPMPEGLRKDVGFILHVSDTACEMVPLNLKGLEPVIAGIAAINAWKALPKKSTVGAVMPRLKEREPAKFEDPIIDPIPIEPLPAETPRGPVADPETRWNSYRERVQKLSKDAREDLVFNWPTDTPKLKTFDHTVAHLDAIDAVLWATECKFAAPAPVVGSPAEESAMEKVMKAFPKSKEVLENF